MENQPLVSILINNYNYGRFLKDAIDSALSQTYPSIEIIVVDDGSTDESKDIITSYGNQIKSVLKSNGGQASAFNAGFAVSQGEILCFLDSDDLFKSHKVESVVHDFQKDKMIGWHFHSLEIFGNHSENKEQEPDGVSSDLSGIYDLKPYMSRGKLKGSLSFELSTATSGTCFRRSLLEKILPMPEEIRITSDDYIKYAALGTSRGFVSFELLACQRIHGNNAYTLRTDISKLRARVQLMTAFQLRRNFPMLSKFSNNLAALGVSLHWKNFSIDAEMQSLIKGYLASTTPLEVFEIYARAMYYRFRFL